MADWREALPEAERADPAIKDIADIPALVKVYKDTKSFVGTSIRPPGPDASPAARKEFLEKMQKHAPELASFGEDPESQAPWPAGAFAPLRSMPTASFLPSSTPN